MNNISVHISNFYILTNDTYLGSFWSNNNSENLNNFWDENWVALISHERQASEKKWKWAEFSSDWSSLQCQVNK